MLRTGGAADNGTSVLVTDDVNGQNRSAVSAVRALAQAGFRPVVSTCGRYSVAAASRHCAGRVQLPAASEDGYAAALHRELRNGDYLTALPASDVALLALGTSGAKLVHKGVLADRAREAGLAVLPGRIYESVNALRADATNQSFPIVVKSAVKLGQDDVQARRVDSVAQVAQLPNADGDVIVQPYITDSLRAVTGVAWGGEFLALSHQRYLRLWPPGAGVGSAAVTVEPDRALEEPLLALLSEHDGIFQAQFVGDYLLDVNPRVFGSLSLTVAAGANLPAIASDAARSRRGALVRGRVGVCYRWLEGDLRHLARARARGEITTREALRRMVPRRGTAHSIESVTDPLPSLLRIASAVHKRTE